MRKLLLLLIALGLTACKVDLYTQLEEKEAVEMMALLLKHGIDCKKLPGKDGIWTLRVDESQVTAAVERLKVEGFPRKDFESIGEVFKQEGLVSSPLTERVRFVYALSQELSQTISYIDGVLDARVHVVVPENDPLAPEIKPASASVFVRHRADSPIEDSIPQIKHLVVNSIEGLTYEKVSVATFPSSLVPEPVRPQRTRKAAAIALSVLVPVLLILLGVAAWSWRDRLLPQNAEPNHA